MRALGLSICRRLQRPAWHIRTAALSTTASRHALSHQPLEGVRARRELVRPDASDLDDLLEHNKSLVFVSSVNNPYENLALEHHLLTTSKPDSHILFLYFNRPCIVIGRNQNPWVECNLPLALRGLPPMTDSERGFTKRVSVPVVRRRSGGGTVFHDAGNLNYCAIVPNDKSFNRNLYAEMIVRALNNVRILNTQTFPGFGGEEVKVNERHDIVMRRASEAEGWLKVSGSAYKLTRGRALHHGTLLLASPHINRISPLLNGPGKTLIDAKGVASVRSPVGNLSPATDLSDKTLSDLHTNVRRAIISEWTKMHPSPQQPIRLFASDCNEFTNPTIAQGINELKSPEWKYLQTPTFTFHSARPDPTQPEVSATNLAPKLEMEVVRGVVTRARVLPRHGNADVQNTPWHELSGTPRAVHVHEMTKPEWRAWLDRVVGMLPTEYVPPEAREVMWRSICEVFPKLKR